MDIKLQSHIISLFIPVSSPRICLSDNILPPLKRNFPTSPRHRQKRHGEKHQIHPVVPAEFNRTPAIHNQIAE